MFCGGIGGTAGPSASLRCAQDDRVFGGGEKIEAGPSLRSG
jgi:hypothetical protein